MRAAVALVVGLVAAGIGFGVVKTVGLAIAMLGSFHGFHPTARLVPVATSEAPAAPLEVPEKTLTPEPVGGAAPPPKIVSDDTPSVDAGHDAGHDAVARPTPHLVDAGAAAVLLPAPRRARCNAEIVGRVDALYGPTASFRSRFEQKLVRRALGSTTLSP